MAKRSASRAVSPVVGTILMVAITIVLAAVLWLMVSGMISEMDDETIDISGVVVEKSEEPEHWIIVENEENGKNYTIESKAFWVIYNVDDNFDEEDIPKEKVEKI